MKGRKHLRRSSSLLPSPLRSISTETKVESESHSCMDCPWNSLGQNTGLGSLFLLQGIFPKRGSNPGLLHCRQILYQLSHKESPRILEWVVDWFDLLSVQGTLKSPLQHHNLKAIILWPSAYFMIQLSHLNMTTLKPKL